MHEAKLLRAIATDDAARHAYLASRDRLAVAAEALRAETVRAAEEALRARETVLQRLTRGGHGGR